MLFELRHFVLRFFYYFLKRKTRKQMTQSAAAPEGPQAMTAIWGYACHMRQTARVFAVRFCALSRLVQVPFPKA